MERGGRGAASRSARAAVLALTACAGCAAGQTCDWAGVYPERRSYPGAAFDTVRGEMVMFGGNNGEVTFGDTWTFRDDRWRQVSVTGPAPRYGAAVCFDSVRGRVVLVGGTDLGLVHTYGDTWEWDGTAWSLVAATGPGPCALASMAFDPVRGRSVLFGGENGPSLRRETWEWDGNAWALRAVDGPSAREVASSVYDPDRGAVVLHGGNDQISDAHDTWAWDGASWSRIATAGWHTEAYQGTVHDPVHHRLLHFVQGLVWVFGPAGWEGFPVPSQAVWRGAALVYNPLRARVESFGGRLATSNQRNSMTWVWAWDEGSTVLCVAPMSKAPRAFFDPVLSRVAMVSLTESQTEFSSWDGRRWASLPAPPPGLGLSAIAYDDARHRAILHGGQGLPAYRETWEWDGASWTRRADGPRRSRHGLAYDAARQRTVLFGGDPGSGPYVTDETWEYDGQSWTLRATGGPPARSSLALAYCGRTQRVTLFGGFPAGVAPLADTWEWDGSAWQQRSVVGPGARGAHAMCTLPDGRIALSGGYDGLRALGDTWIWDGGSWQLAAVMPTRFEHAMAYDAERNVLVVVGMRGESFNSVYPRSDVYELSCIPCFANCDGSTGQPALNALDFTCFLSRFAAGDSAANCDGSSVAPVLNVLDFICFLNRFNQGCQ